MINHYWSMTGFKTYDHTSAVRQVRRIVDEYQTLLKSRSKTNAKAIRDRQAFLEDLKTCLDIGEGGMEALRESLRTDRVRVNLGIAAEDIEFLDDQFGPRHQAMSHKVDAEFARRKAANLKRKLSSVPQPGPSTAEPLPSGDGLEDEEESDEDDNANDPDYVDKSRKEKKSDRITVSIPRNVFMSPALIASLDRCKTSDCGVMRTFAQLFKQCETEDGNG